jgi:hypothetical protein
MRRLKTKRQQLAISNQQLAKLTATEAKVAKEVGIGYLVLGCKARDSVDTIETVGHFAMPPKYQRLVIAQIDKELVRSSLRPSRPLRQTGWLNASCQLLIAALRHPPTQAGVSHLQRGLQHAFKSDHSIASCASDAGGVPDRVVGCGIHL